MTHAGHPNLPKHAPSAMIADRTQRVSARAYAFAGRINGSAKQGQASAATHGSKHGWINMQHTCCTEISSLAARRLFSHGSGTAVLEGQRQDLEILDPGKAACAVELERRGVAAFCLNRQADGPRGGSRLADGTNGRPRHPAAPRAGYDVQIPELPRTAQPKGCGKRHGSGQASQVLPRCER
jgi:hypothetical protein